MEIAPAGTVDPTPSLYNTTMYCMAALLVIAFFANLFLKPVKPHHFMETEAEREEERHQADVAAVRGAPAE